MNISSKMIKLYLNKVKSHYFIAILSFLLLFFSSLNILSQTSELGLPFIENFSIRDYGTDGQNFSIAQDEDRIMYFGNLSGVLKYNELEWSLTDVHGWPYISADDSGKVFVASFNEFGYVETNDNGIDKFISLKEKFINKSNFGVVNNLLTFEDHVFFETPERLYHYYKDYVFLVDSGKTNKTTFKVDGQLYVNNSSRGLIRLSYGEFVDIPGGEYFKGKEIVDILPYNNNLLVKLAKSSSFLLYDFRKVTPIETQADLFLKTYSYVKGLRLSDGTFAMATSKNGIIFLDAKLNILFHVNKLKGLNDNSVSDLFIDHSNNLWAALRNGISRIEFPSGYTYFSHNCGIEGGVLSITRHKGRIYAGTLSGLFAMDRGIINDNEIPCVDKKAFSKVSEISGVVYDLISIGKDFYAVTDNGLYHVNGKLAENIYPVPLRAAMLSKNNNKTLFIGGEFGFTALELRGNEATDLGKLSGFKKRVRTIGYDKKGNIWCGTNNYGVYKIPPFKKYSTNISPISYPLDKFPIDKVSWVDVYTTRTGAIFSTEGGLFRFDSRKDEFVKDKMLKIDYENNSKWVYPIVEDVHGNLILSMGTNNNFEKETMIAQYDHDNNEFNFIKDPFKRIMDFSVEEFHPDLDQVLWIGGTDGLIRYDQLVTTNEALPFRTVINNIYLKKDSLLYINSDLDYTKRTHRISIDYGFNSLKFTYVCPAFLGNNMVEYQIFLDNFDTDWSDWNHSKSKEYTSLPPGTYEFNVRAKVKNKITNIAKVGLTIKAPFYRTFLAYIIYAILLISTAITYFKYRAYQFAKEKNKLEKIIKERTDELLKEIERAQDLLVNMLPKQTADELKLKGKASTRKFKLVTVLFSDIQGFTGIAEIVDPDVLVSKLDEFFYNVDKIIEKHKIEKIKTIGDGYMCAGGIPEKDRTNPITVILAGLEIISYMKTFEFDKNVTDNINWGLRVGIHSGPVIAGVIGTKKYSYDIWGVTVNTASRLETNGTAGRINISETTYNLVKDYFDCEYNNNLALKSGAEINMYHVNGILPQYSLNGEGRIANNKLIFRLSELRYNDLYDFIMDKLENELPGNLYYHDVKHTIDVVVQVEIIGKAERVSKEDLLLLKTAALFHDVGFTVNYDNHELHGFKLAKEVLPRYQYTRKQIELIGQLIMITKFPPEPKTKLEMIICDADLDYLGRKDFVPVSRNLFMELYERKRIKSVNEWLKTQIKFIEKHTYFTDTAINKRDVNKNQQLENIKKMDFLSSFF